MILAAAQRLPELKRTPRVGCEEISRFGTVTLLLSLIGHSKLKIFGPARFRAGSRPLSEAVYIDLTIEISYPIKIRANLIRIVAHKWERRML